MGTRGANRRSSIYLGADERWHGYVTMAVRSDGSLDRRHVKRKTKASATQAVRKLERERDEGRATEAGRSFTVTEWLTTYLDTIAVQKLVPKTWGDYWSLTRTWIIQELGNFRLNHLEAERLDALYARMLRNGRVPSTVLKVHRVLSRALKIAVRRRKVSYNVAESIDPPSVPESEQKTLTLNQVRDVIKVAMNQSNGVQWAIGLTCGLRQGEVLGLRWQYVDLDTGDVRVWGQIQRVKWRHGGMAARTHTNAVPDYIVSRANVVAPSTRSARNRALCTAHDMRAAAQNATVGGWYSDRRRAGAGVSSSFRTQYYHCFESIRRRRISTV
jgi:integrase